jgi:hypothetical protein
MSYPGWRIHECIKVDLTYEDIFKGFELDPPHHHNNKLPILVREAEVQKVAKRKGRNDEGLEVPPLVKPDASPVSMPLSPPTLPLLPVLPPPPPLPMPTKVTQTSKKVFRVLEPPPRKRNRKDIIYPSDIAHLSESAKEKWRLEKIYSENKKVV